MNVGLSASTTEVVANGVVAPGFTGVGVQYYTFQIYFAWQEFFLSLSTGADQVYAATVTNANQTVLTSSLDESTDSGLVKTTRQNVLRVSTVCQADGEDVITITIQLTGYDNLVLSYHKQCKVSVPRLGLSVSTVDWTAGRVADVAIDGLVLEQWLDDQSGPNTAYDLSVDSVTFYMWVDSGQQQYVIVSTAADQTIMNPSVPSTTGLIHTATFGSGQRAQITVNFNCIAGGPGGSGWVSLALSIDPFNPVSFAWFKQCPTPLSKWSGFGIFCFVMFILTTIACTGGCIYKYSKLHARGIEVLPFIDNYRTWYARYCGKVCNS
jgi:hypothetical protein